MAPVHEALNHLTRKYEESIEEITMEMQPCDHCRNQKYETYVLLTVLGQAFVRVHWES